MHYLTEEAGASAAEYALILALVSGLCIVGLSFMGREIGLTLRHVGSAMRPSGA